MNPTQSFANAVPVLRAPALQPGLPVPDSGAWARALAPEVWSVWALVAVGLGATLAGLWIAMLLGRQIRAVSSVRLVVESVRFTGLVAGSRPVFFARVRNMGSVDADEVAATISAVYQGGGGKVGAPQKMVVPAHGSRDFFLRWQTALTTAVREDILCGTSRLCVKVTVQYGSDPPLKHCYQYYPWDGEKLDGLPDFIPCDLDSQLGGISAGRSARFQSEEGMPGTKTASAAEGMVHRSG